MYQAIIARVKTKPHPNADRIQLGDVLGNQVVVGLDTQDGELGIYFPSDGILSHEYCLANNLYNKSARTALGLPEGPTGFFDLNRRIRTQGFRGEKSDGLWMPLSSLDYAVNGMVMYADDLSEGQMFTHHNGIPICEKWYSRKPQGPTQAKVKGRKKGEIPGFPKHMDTDQWAYYKDQIPVGSILTISEKLHGTSHRAGIVLNDERLWWQFWKPRWVRLDGSRNVIIGTQGQGYYGSDDFRHRAVHTVGRKGEVLFGEIVGFTQPGYSIMPSVVIDKKELPDEFVKYSGVVHYHYGQASGHCEFFVYRIVQFNEDGEGVELSDAQVRKRAEQLGYRCPPLLTMMLHYESEFIGGSSRTVELLTGDPSTESTLAPGQMSEGVVIRVDQPDGHTKFYKSKSYAFKLLEGIIKSNEDYNDVEESA